MAAGLALVASAASASVLVATDETFKSIVLDSGLPSIVEIYASWCGHCKRLEPIWDALGTAYEGKNVQVVKIDGDVNRQVSTEYGVRSFPTLKFFDANGQVEDVNAARDLESLASYVAKRTGVPSGVKPKPASTVVELTEDTLEDFVRGGGDGAGKTVLVFFTASWCGVCGPAAKQFEQAAQIFRRDASSVVFAQIDLSQGGNTIATEFEVDTLPAILVFDASSSNPPNKYKGKYDLDELAAGVNDAAGLDRQLDGTLGPKAGRYHEMDAVATQFALSSAADDRAAHISKLAQFVQAASGADLVSAKLYHRYASKIAANEHYLTKELARLAGLLAKSGLSEQKKDEMKVKLNILSAFVVQEEQGASEQDAKDEL